MSDHSLLTDTLAIAVPLWVDKLRSVPFDEILSRASELSTIIGSQGDIILYRSKKKGETAKAFNALAEAIAALSFAPGGVTFAGSHWESGHD